MPELPEVETIVRELKRELVGDIIIDVWTDSSKNLQGNFSEFKKEIKNKKIIAVKRRGKNIFLFLEEDKIIWIHLKMTGHLLIGKYKFNEREWVPVDNDKLLDPNNRYLHWVFLLRSGRALVLSDRRKMAKIVLLSNTSFAQQKSLKKLGIEPLSSGFTPEVLKTILRRSKSEIKRVLMNQEYIAGIGNIYANEILWKAGINPWIPSNKLQESQIIALHRAIKEVLSQAIAHRGTSAKDDNYRDIYGERGKFSSYLKVYQREGEPCPKCGTLIKRKKQAGRSTFYCPRCQK